jgi:hypothetical protein
MALPIVDNLETEFDVPSERRGRGPDRGPRAPSGFKKAVEEIAQVIFSKTRISVEGAARAVVPSIPRMIQDISDDIRTGSVEKFKVSLEKLESIISKLGLDLNKYNKDLAGFLKQRQENLVKSEEKVREIREQGAKAEINQITGEIDFLSRAEIKQRRDTLRETLINIKDLEKEKNKEEKKLQESRFLSEEEIETKKQFVEKSYDTLKELETNKQTLMKTLNIQSEEDLPSTSFFGRFRRPTSRNDRQGGEGIREYVPNFLLDIGDAFKQQITGFFEPLVMLKDTFLDILKPLKIFKTLLGPIVTSMKGLLVQLGRQIKTGIALVAVNLLRILTDKKVLIGLLAVAAALGVKKLIDVAGDKIKENVEEKKDQQLEVGNVGAADAAEGLLTGEVKDSKGKKIILPQDIKPPQSSIDEFKQKYNIESDRLSDLERQKKNIETSRFLTESDRSKQLAAINNQISNIQSSATSSTTAVSGNNVSNDRNHWFHQTGSF